MDVPTCTIPTEETLKELSGKLPLERSFTDSNLMELSQRETSEEDMDELSCQLPGDEAEKVGSFAATFQPPFAAQSPTGIQSPSMQGSHYPVHPPSIMQQIPTLQNQNSGGSFYGSPHMMSAMQHAQTPSVSAYGDYVPTPGTDVAASGFPLAAPTIDQSLHQMGAAMGLGQPPMTPGAMTPAPAASLAGGMTPRPGMGAATPAMSVAGASAYPPQCLMSVKPADQMDHIEASRWIGTIGRLKKWAEADMYERNCLHHEISGFMLSQLTMSDLEKVIGMKKHGHRLEIWCSIRQIFPYLLPFERVNPRQENMAQPMSSMSTGNSYSASQSTGLEMLQRGSNTMGHLSTGTKSVGSSNFRKKVVIKESKLKPQGAGGASDRPPSNQSLEVVPLPNLDHQHHQRSPAMDMARKWGRTPSNNGPYGSGMHRHGGHPAFRRSKSSSYLSEATSGVTDQSDRESQASKAGTTRLILTLRDDQLPLEADATKKPAETESKEEADKPTEESTAAEVEADKEEKVDEPKEKTPETEAETETKEKEATPEAGKEKTEGEKKPAAKKLSKVAMMAEIRNYFMDKFQLKVEIGTVEANDKQYILFFRSEQETNRALSMQDQFEYDVAPYVEPAKKKTKRPTPKEPLRYMVLNRSRLRAGKSMKSEWQGDVYKGDIVWVNQIKGRRARIIRAQNDATVRGWVSLRSNNGFQLLTQFHDNE